MKSGPPDLGRSYRRGDRGPKVVLVQEWLCLNGHQVVIDGGFGPATEFATRQFQEEAGLRPNGVVGPVTFAALMRPMISALKPIPAGGRSLGDLVCRYARQHLKSAPREVGGQNRGPWVRLYMDGRQGEEWAWCAGFVCFIVRQACGVLETALPLVPSFSCDSLAAGARERGIFVSGPAKLDPEMIPPGSIFLNRRTSTDWTHTGIVLGCQEEVLETVEGNTNDDGNREGFEVCRRWRGLKSKDFIRID